MADNRKYVQAKDYALYGAGIGITDVTIKLTSMKLPNSGVPIDMTMFGKIGFGTLEPETNREENISFDGIIQNLIDGSATLTGVVRGLGLVDPYTPIATLRRSHAGSTRFRITNPVQLYDSLANKYNDEDITGSWKFFATGAGANPKIDDPTYVPAADDYIVRQFLTGGVYDYFDDTGAVNAIVITPVPAIAGYVAGQHFFIKVLVTNTGSTTVNINGLGPIALKKQVTVDLDAGDILAGQIILVTFDGVNFQLIAGSGGSGSGGGGIVTRSARGAFTLANGVTTLIDTEGTSGANAGNVMTSSGSIKNLYINSENNTFNGNTVYTLLRNGVPTTVTVTVPAATNGILQDVINSFAMVGGDLITLQCDTTASGLGVGNVSFSYQVGGVAATDFQIFTVNGVWTKLAGAKTVEVICVGAGGGGGGGFSRYNSNAANGGCGGGAAAVTREIFDASLLGVNETVTVGVGGTGGAGFAGGTGSGVNGTDGTLSSFGTWSQAGGGGGGERGAGGARLGGGGGGSLTSAVSDQAGVPQSSNAIINVNGISGQGTWGSFGGNPSIGNAEYGGGTGGGNTPDAGGSSIFGAGGGGAADNSGVLNGQAGGTPGSYTAGGGGAGGTGGAVPTAGANGADNSVTMRGYGGAGGGGGGNTQTDTLTAGAGGNGGIPGGGAGGGGGFGNAAATSGGSGAGGNGGRGQVTVITYF